MEGTGECTSKVMNRKVQSITFDPSYLMSRKIFTTAQHNKYYTKRTPEEGMVIMSTPIVPHRRPGLQSIQLQLQNINLILSLRSLVDVGNISSMMLIMMDFHGRSIDVGLEGLKGVVKVGNRVGVGYEGCSDGGGDGGSLLEDLSAVGSGLCGYNDVYVRGKESLA
jgi:hypothetical protein|eukprot:scaffold121_cov168-Alexandrium_tamarense.AAC.3